MRSRKHLCVHRTYTFCINEYCRVIEFCSICIYFSMLKDVPRRKGKKISNISCERRINPISWNFTSELLMEDKFLFPNRFVYFIRETFLFHPISIKRRHRNTDINKFNPPPWSACGVKFINPEKRWFCPVRPKI